MWRILLFATVVEIVHCSCPSGYELVSQGECRGLNTTMNLYWDERAVNTAVTTCDKMGAHAVYIHNDEQQSYWTERGWLILGLVCNPDTWKWWWADRSPVDYKPRNGNYHPALDKPCVGGCSWDILNTGYWDFVCNGKKMYSTEVYCIKQLEQPQPYSDGCEYYEIDVQDGMCYQVGDYAENFQDAQMVCRSFGSNLASIHNAQENSFIRRMAVASGLVNGLYIGAKSSGMGTNNFGWVDGSNWTYSNFYPGFPRNGLGYCLSMDTSTSNGLCMNVNCNSKLPVVCGRDKRAIPQISCSSEPYQEGGIVTSPGFPYSASTPCDFFLTVDGGKRVKAEITLEANKCCDSLVLYDGYIGGKVIATLTGEVFNATYVSTTNIMRVSWKPRGGVHVKGMALGFRGI